MSYDNMVQEVSQEEVIYTRKIDFEMNYNRPVRFEHCGDRIFIKECDYPVKCNVRRIDKYTFINMNTGEICKYDTATEKRKSNVARAMYELRKIISCNLFDRGYNTGIFDFRHKHRGKKYLNDAMFVTLTYKENMTNEAQLQRDWELFYKWLCRQTEDKLSYISVIEPQGRGAYHIHAIVFTAEHCPLFIAQASMLERWRDITGGGGCNVERPLAHGIADYLCAYFTDTIDDTGARKKGRRLGLYKKGMRIYRTSNNVARPIAYDGLSLGDLMSGGYRITYSNTTEVISENYGEARCVQRVHSVVLQKPYLGYATSYTSSPFSLLPVMRCLKSMQK